MQNSQQNNADVLVIGGGVIGLACAYSAAREGAAVVVIDGGLPGQASPVAAGMLAPLAEAETAGPFVAMGIESLRHWSGFVEQLRSDSQTPIAVYGPGMLRLARTESEERRLSAAFEWQKTLGLPMCWLHADEVRELEPDITSDMTAAILSPSEQVVEPLLLHLALRQACEGLGVQIVSGAIADGFDSTGQRVTSVKTNNGTFSAGQYLVAGGAWTDLIGRLIPAHLPVSPLRGQILTLRPQKPAHLRHTVYVHGGYLVPRPDGRIISGATEEKAGFSVEARSGATAMLLKLADDLIPSFSNAQTDQVGVGLRPVSPDGLPILGPLPGWDNIHIAAGHGRNGILLTPITASWIAGSLLRHIPPPVPFSPARFLGLS